MYDNLYKHTCVSCKFSDELQCLVLIVMMQRRKGTINYDNRLRFNTFYQYLLDYPFLFKAVSCNFNKMKINIIKTVNKSYNIDRR